MKRGGPLKRRTPLRRRTRINPVNAKRRKSSRARAFGDLAEYVRGLGCLACNRRPVEAAHVRSRGAGFGAWLDDGAGNLIPLCTPCHREQHDRGIRTFAAEHGLDLAAEAKRIGEAFDDHRRRLEGS